MMIKRTSMALCLLLAACNGGEESAPAPEPTNYEDMSFQQREVFMTDVVLPQMKEIFVAFDPKFSTMDCKTCHGGGASDGSYAMPSQDIPKLPATEEAFGEYVKDPEHARWSQFMLDKVWPPMASMLQVAKFDPATNPTGFSCSNCHTVMVEGTSE
jgi:hypothetical protein